MRLMYAVPLAVAGGLLLDLASPEVSFWPASVFGAMCILAALWGQRVRVGVLVGAVGGAAFWGPHVFWLTLYLGPVPWLGLLGAMVFWFTLFGGAVAFVTTMLPAVRLPWPNRPGARRLTGVILQALAVAGLWVLREQLQGSVPYGGFAWGRLAHMQADGPLVESVSWVGFAGLTGLIAFAAAIPVAAVRSGSSAAGVRGLAVAGPVVIVGVLAAIPAFVLPQTDTVTVAAVQGNSKSGIFDDRDSGDVLRDHISATEEMLDAAEEAEVSLDVIVWPENSGELDLRSNVPASRQIAQLSKRADAPIVLGTVIAENGEYTNSSLVWGPQGEEPGRYDKRYPVPFAEYMPHRPFYRALAPDLVDLVQLEYEHGEISPVVGVDTAAGLVQAGLAICFDIIFDQHAVALVDDGAQVIFAQTNNADFGRTDESAQQLAIAKLRGIETGRALVNISTVGTSAIIAPDGRTIASLPTHTADSMVAAVPLVEGRTPALMLGTSIAALWCTVGVLALSVSAAARFTPRFRGARAGS